MNEWSSCYPPEIPGVAARLLTEQDADQEEHMYVQQSSLGIVILYNVILDRYHVQLMSCDRQFGFKPKSFTNLCSMVLKETVAYYVQNQNPVFCTFLDSTKAFDRFNYCKLFKLLVKRELPVLIIANLYMNNLVRVF